MTTAKKLSLAKPQALPNDAAIDAIIDKGAAVPDTETPAATPAPEPKTRVQTSVYLAPEILARVETARKSNELVTLDRNQWMRAAIIEKLIKDGF